MALLLIDAVHVMEIGSVWTNMLLREAAVRPMELFSCPGLVSRRPPMSYILLTVGRTVLLFDSFYSSFFFLLLALLNFLKAVCSQPRVT